MVVEKVYKYTEIGIIPDSWTVKKISDVSAVKRGAGSQYTNYTDESNGLRFIRINDFFENNPVYVRRTKDIIRFIIESNDILIAGTGNTAGSSFMPKKEWIGYPHSYNAPRIRVNILEIDKRFLLYCLQSRFVLNQQKALFVGAAQPFLDISAISGFLIPLPPLPEQTAIASALSDMDTLIAQAEKIIEKKKAIKQGVMQELLRPKEGWVTKKLGEICEIVMGQSPLSQYYNVSGIGLPLIQGNADIKKRKTIIRSFSSNITKKGKPGDIIMTVRAPVGEIALAEFECCLGRGVCSIRYKNNFIYHYLIFIENYWGRLSSGSTFDSVNSSQIKELTVSMPLKIEEQIEISEILTNLDNDLELTETKLKKLKLQKQGMMQALLTGKIRLV